VSRMCYSNWICGPTDCE